MVFFCVKLGICFGKEMKCSKDLYFLNVFITMLFCNLSIHLVIEKKLENIVKRKLNPIKYCQ